MSTERILVRGSPLQAGVIGAYLASRWLGPGRSLELAVGTEDKATGSFATRPSVHRFHAEMGLPIDQLFARCGGSPILAAETRTADGAAVQLPFSAFGVPRGGVEFHQYWLRASRLSQQADLTEFSLSLALQNAAHKPPLAQLEQLPVDFGIAFDRSAYGNALLSFAKAGGASVIEASSEQAQSASLVIQCSSDAQAPKWQGQELNIAQQSGISGLEWHALSSATRRFANLAAPLSDCVPEQAEWTRLALAQRERMADMQELLNIEDPLASTRPALQRKAEVFAACGRIPTEDYEVFTPPEWLAALWARGVRPRRSDRMAERLTDSQLLDWLDQLRGQIASLTRQVQAA